jgi:hypothetical protein
VKSSIIDPMKSFFSTLSTPFKIMVIALFVFFVNMSSISAQSDTLQARFDELMLSSETYQQFKVIRINRLNELFSEVQDTIKTNQQQALIIQQQLETQKEEVSRLSSKIEEINTELSITKDKLGKIDFIGIPFEVSTYHLIVWALILILAGLSVFVYTMFLRANSVSKSISGEHQALIREFEAFKERSREKEVKIKRELQTTINTLEELKRGSKK